MHARLPLLLAAMVAAVLQWPASASAPAPDGDRGLPLPGVVSGKAAIAALGADAAIMALYTESSDPLNHAFLLCRQRASVVGIGAFGMNIDRQKMYSRDIAFYPSLAYAPGRYDHVYEEGGVDYAIGYARWTENRNMGAFLRLIAEGAVDVDPLSPVRIPLENAPDAYALLRSPERPPTVLLTYEMS